ncbi:MAG: TenA family protein [Vulcanisaeta sp. AZ3]|jgi:thiaminase|nr:MAG: TenA family transcriptional regulator [Vulcanisaeta sp. AZ3]
MATTHEKLRELVGDLWDKYVKHEFVEMLKNGSLPRDVFRYYLIQDLKYVREMQSSMIEAASRAPLEDAVSLLPTMLGGAKKEVVEAHEKLFSELSITEDEVNRTGFNLINYAYTRHLHYYAHLGWPQFLAALTPCAWGYYEVGKYARGSKDPLYNTWANAYASEDYWSPVEAMLKVLDKYEVTPEMEKAFKNSVNFEIMFWDAALRKDPTIFL